MISNDRKAILHIAKQQLRMADADYRALLQNEACVRSSRDLDDAGFEKVMAAFERLGFRRTTGRAQKTRREGFATPAQIGKIRSLWFGYIGRDDEAALRVWLEKHFHVSHPRFLEGWRAGKAIAVLLKMQKHENAKHPVGRKHREPQPA